MKKDVAEGRFREDLYYRINVMGLDLPPLRNRDSDIELLVNQFLGKDHELEDDARQALIAYTWPGNIRQLINTLERAKILADDGQITLSDLPDELRQQKIDIRAAHSIGTALPLDGSLITLQRAHIAAVLQRENGNKSKAAKALGIERRKLYRMIEEHDIGG